MDWKGAIEHHHAALRRIVAVLVAMAGLVRGGDVSTEVPETLPRHLHRTLLRLLRPAEAAARRLIILAARGIEAPPPGPVRDRHGPGSAFLARPGGTGIVMPKRLRGRGAARSFSLPICDDLPLPHGGRAAPVSVPRVCCPGVTVPLPVPVRRVPLPDDPLDARALRGRLAALSRVLDTLPRQALRYARWRARRRRGPFHRVWPLRGGRPPGWRRPCGPRAHAVHGVLDDLHGLAFFTLVHPDSS